MAEGEIIYNWTQQEHHEMIGFHQLLWSWSEKIKDFYVDPF